MPGEQPQQPQQQPQQPPQPQQQQPQQQQQQQRTANSNPVFKMNDFWTAARSGQLAQQAQNLTATSNQNSPVAPNSVPAHSPSQHSTGSSQQNHVITQGALALQQQQQQNNVQQQQMQQQMNHQQQQQQAQQQQQNSVQQQQAAAVAAAQQAQQQQQQQQQAQQQQQQQQPQQQQLPSGQNSPDKMTEKFVNELQIFMHKSAMQMHARELTRGTEVKPHQCQQCLKSFSSNHQLVQHIRVHTGEKPYKCSYCDRRFKQLSHVQQHTRLHTGERPYKCHLPDCGRAFIQLSNLQQHLRNHDAQVERAKNRPFHCNICGKGFATESSLRTHTSKVSHCVGRLQQHAALIGGPNATSCPLCHKMFLGGEALMEHMKHTHKDPNASGVATKRRTANHPCPVCGKHYVNEGSLRKHLACHPETSQLSSSLRMWPCSVCQAVFTHESGLLTHMEHMRMDPKHQFAAQYVLSRAAAERRERETLLAAVSASASGSGLLGLTGMAGLLPGGNFNANSGASPMCASPSAHSDSSSGNGRLSSAGSDAGGVLNNNNNNCNTKLGDILRGQNGLQHHQYNMDEQTSILQHNANRMAVMAAAAGMGGGGLGATDSATAANLAVAANIAAAMRLSQQANVNPSGGVNNSSNPGTPPIGVGNDTLSASAAMNAAMRASMDSIRNMDAMRMDTQPQQQQHQQHQQDAMRMHQAEVLLRSQAEAALRLAMSQAAAAAANQQENNSPLRYNGNCQSQGQPSQQLSPDLTEALRLQEHRLEQALRLHGSDPRSLGFSLSTSQQHQP